MEIEFESEGLKKILKYVSIIIIFSIIGFLLVRFTSLKTKTLGKYVAFVILVALPLYLERDQISDRLLDLKNNYKGLIYVPISVVILISTFILALQLADWLPILNYGWLGENIAVTPAADSVEDVKSSGGGVSLFGLFKFLFFMAILVLAMVVFNYMEEELLRDNYKEVVIWALLHLVMGIPIFAVIPIFSVGVFYKIIRDKKGLGKAYVVHFGTNLFLVLLLGLSALLRFV